MNSIVGRAKRNPVDPDAVSLDTNSSDSESHTSSGSSFLDDALFVPTVRLERPRSTAAVADARILDPPGDDLLSPDNNNNNNNNNRHTTSHGRNSETPLRPPPSPLPTPSQIPSGHTGTDDLLVTDVAAVAPPPPGFANSYNNIQPKRSSTVRPVHFDFVEVRAYFDPSDDDDDDDTVLDMTSAIDEHRYQCDEDTKVLDWEAHFVSIITTVDDYEASRLISRSVDSSRNSIPSLQSNDKAQSRMKNDRVGEFSRVRQQLVSGVDDAFSATASAVIYVPFQETNTMDREDVVPSVAFASDDTNNNDDIWSAISDTPSVPRQKLPKHRITNFVRRLVGRPKATKSMNHM